MYWLVNSNGKNLEQSINDKYLKQLYPYIWEEGERKKKTNCQ